MVKKGRADNAGTAKRMMGNNEPFAFLSTTFENVDRKVVQNHIILLIGISLLTKLIVLFATPLFFHSFIDYFDLGFYFEHAVKLLEGQLPYIDYSFDYPVLLFVPITLALIPALVFQNAFAFIYTFQLLMVGCDIITIVCVYLIALRIWNEKTAFMAGLLSATAFATAYFTLTKFDAFPTCFLMLAVMFTLYGHAVKGYLAAGLGFFTKVFPVISVPFLVLFNAKKNSSLKDEIIALLKVMVPLCIILILPLLLIRPGSISTYLFATGANVGVYANTLTYTLYSWLNGVLHLGVTPDTISLVMYSLMGVTILYLLYFAYTDTSKKPDLFLKLILCALVAVVLFTKFHSPQYLVWYTPFLCLLVAEELNKIVLFFAVQIFAYIEFPLMFGSFYVNLQYTNPAGSTGWYLTLVFFTLQYLVLSILIAAILLPKGYLAGITRSKPS
jgi:hypothetical protein